ncbi:MAG: Asp-tRNA(Asn)/Glu-tRNA(Gln) amidotransferase subunit GatA, partial [Candidatus Latescibacteria bacterium]|nr:Asp-tRNA(Asn)/Glu-tRNA(Gln) amidotransferase subunit GatA [Candidatus Latescibacterota bacterium]
HDLVRAIKAQETTSRQLTESVYDQIRNSDPRINAYITLDESNALSKADEVDRRASAGESLGPLAGVPVALKDLLCTRGLPTTCGSRILEGFTPPYDATAVERLREADAVLVGKLNMDEFAMGSSNENSAYGPCLNPHDLTRVPGGSSGGAAAAVAAGQTVLALGTDTGGSIRQPASFCGVVGLKPTYGRVSRYGLVAYASSLDQIGPITRSVQDAALLLGVIAGKDPNDSTSADVPVPDYVAQLDRGVQGLTVGLPKEHLSEGLDDDVREAVMRGVDLLESAGAQVEEVSLPVAGHPAYSIAAYYIIATGEASSNLARYDGVKYGLRVDADDLVDMYCGTRSAGFGTEVKRRIMLGTYALSAGYYDAYYLKAQRVRTLIKEDFDRALETCDLLAAPVSPSPAFRVGEKVDDPLQMYLSDIYTVSVNLAGIPGLAVPSGTTSQGLPTGLQLLGRPFEEEVLLRAGAVIEQGQT